MEPAGSEQVADGCGPIERDASPLVGNGQTIELQGKCGDVTSLGNDKHVTLDGAKSLKITGNGNTFTYKEKPGSINILGDGNTVEAAH